MPGVAVLGVSQPRAGAGGEIVKRNLAPLVRDDLGPKAARKIADILALETAIGRINAPPKPGSYDSASRKPT